MAFLEKRGDSPVLPVRFSPQLKAAIEAIAHANGETRSDVVRRLVAVGMQHEKPGQVRL